MASSYECFKGFTTSHIILKLVFSLCVIAVASKNFFKTNVS